MLLLHGIGFQDVDLQLGCSLPLAIVVVLAAVKVLVILPTLLVSFNCNDNLTLSLLDYYRP